MGAANSSAEILLKEEDAWHGWVLNVEPANLSLAAVWAQAQGAGKHIPSLHWINQAEKG